MELNRGVLRDPAVGSFLVVESTPILRFRTRVIKAHEAVRFQTFTTELAVERIDERIVGRLAGSQEAKGDTIRVGPEIEIACDELAALVDPNALRIAHLFTHLPES